MENNFAKPTTSSFTQPNYGANYYAPPSMFQMENYNNTNDLESTSTQKTENRPLYTQFETDLDAQRAERSQRTQQAQAHQVDQAGMYAPIFPKKEEIGKLVIHQNHACTKCYDCQMRIQREAEEKRKKEQECLESCNAFCEVCGAVLMMCDIILQCCALCDASK